MVMMFSSGVGGESEVDGSSGCQAALRASKPGTGWALCPSRVGLGHGACEQRQIVERAGPATLVREGGVHTAEARLNEDHVGLSIALVQRDRYLGRHTRFKVVAFPFVGEDEARWLLDLPVFAAGDIFVSFRRKHAGAPLAAGLEIDLGEEHPEPGGAEPARHMLGLGPGFPDEDSRRIEGSVQDQRMAVSRLAG